MTRHQRLFASLGAGLLFVTACAENDRPVDPEGTVLRLADQYLEAYFQRNPHWETLLGIPGATHERLPDLSPGARQAWQSEQDRLLAELEAISSNRLTQGSPADIAHAFLTTVLRNGREERVCRTELWHVSPTWTGWQSWMAQLSASQPTTTSQQQEAALRRFKQLPEFLDQEMANLREGLSLGYSMPQFNVEGVIRQMENLITAPLAESPFQAMAKGASEEFRVRLEGLETETLRPAIARYRDFLKTEYLPVARTEIAVSANPNGVACYQATVRAWSTVDISPEEIHRIGLREMEMLREEMRSIGVASFGTDDVPVLLERLRTDRRYLVSSREEMLQIARGAVERSRAAIPQWFGLVPESEVIVEPVPAFQEEGAPFAFYRSPADDGSRPGIYYINLRQAESEPRAGVEATAFHEAYPGHHLQNAIALERTDLHAVSRYLYLSGFGEGWALYAERLSDEMGLYSSDLDRFGLLSNEAMRAARLVVDSGMHALGWSRQKSIDYMLANTAESVSSATAEIDRYIAVPGQATAYMLGSLEIRALRELAEAELGENFDIRAFHDRILEDGAVPLSVLRAKINAWVAGH